MKNILITMCTVMIAAFLGAGGFLYVKAHQSSIGQSILVMHAPFLISDGLLIQNLKHDDPALVANTLAVLLYLESDAGAVKAAELLSSPVTNVWLIAAQYRGRHGYHDAVPYLIRGLKTELETLYPVLAAELRQLTGQDFGEDPAQWESWWQSTYPGLEFDFGAHLNNTLQKL